MRKLVLFAAAAAVSAASAQAQMADRKELSAAAARQMVSACEAYARARGGSANIWAVNLRGEPLSFLRMDGANPWRGDWAHAKAQTSAKTGNPTRNVLENFDRRGVTQATGMYYQLEHFAMPGGVPVVVNGSPAGALGVDGLGAEEDEKCALAGIAAVIPGYKLPGAQ